MAGTTRRLRGAALAAALIIVASGLSSCAAGGLLTPPGAGADSAVPTVAPSGDGTAPLWPSTPSTWLEPETPSTSLEDPTPSTATDPAPGDAGDEGAGATDATSSATSPATSVAPDSPGGLTVAAVLEQIPTKGRAPKTGYARTEFGKGWKDPDRNGCDARNDVLARDLSDLTFKPGTRECVVLTGTLIDPYTGTEIAFQRGQATSQAVQIDHVVALSDAWQKGAQRLDAATRQELANDPLNLLAVDGPTNSRKSDGDAATWLPPRKAYRCDYVARQTAVKLKYGLWMTKAEKDAIARVVGGCPGKTIPSAG